MRKIAAVLAAAVLVLGVVGCTRLTYERDGVKVTYEHLFQNKTWEVETTDGTRIRFSSDSDPAVEVVNVAVKSAVEAAIASQIPGQ